MKKLLFLTAIFTMIVFAVDAQAKKKVQPKPKFPKSKVSAAAFRGQVNAALKTQGTQQGMRNIAPGEECGVFVEAKTNSKGESYNSAKEFLIISNDGVTGFGFTFYTFNYQGKKMFAMRGIPLEAGVCVDANTAVYITFEDGSDVGLKNFEDANCKGLVEVYFGELLKNSSAVESLKNQKVKSIKLVAGDKIINKTLSEGNQQQMQGTFKCL